MIAIPDLVCADLVLDASSLGYFSLGASQDVSFFHFFPSGCTTLPDGNLVLYIRSGGAASRKS